MKTAIEILVDARELIRDPKAHTCLAYARNVAGDAVGAAWPDAVCFCAVGALIRSSRGEHHAVAVAATKALSQESYAMGFSMPSDANDIGGHGIAILMFDRAIRRLGAAK